MAGTVKKQNLFPKWKDLGVIARIAVIASLLTSTIGIVGAVIGNGYMMFLGIPGSIVSNMVAYEHFPPLANCNDKSR